MFGRILEWTIGGTVGTGNYLIKQGARQLGLIKDKPKPKTQSISLGNQSLRKQNFSEPQINYETYSGRGEYDKLKGLAKPLLSPSEVEAEKRKRRAAKAAPIPTLQRGSAHQSGYSLNHKSGGHGGQVAPATLSRGGFSGKAREPVQSGNRGHNSNNMGPAGPRLSTPLKRS